MFIISHPAAAVNTFFCIPRCMEKEYSIKLSSWRRFIHTINHGWPLSLVVSLLLLSPSLLWAAEAQDGHSLLTGIGISILAATVLAYLATVIKQPLILAYLAAGVIIGPEMGFAWIRDKAEIQTIAEIGLILLLFMIGLELSLKKIKASGKSLIVTGILQFILCAALGLGFLYLLGFTLQATCPCEYTVLGIKVIGGRYDLLYLAACLALSSTTIVVKLLYEKFELDTLAGRLTLGVLIFQDLWAIVLLGAAAQSGRPQGAGDPVVFRQRGFSGESSAS